MQLLVLLLENHAEDVYGSLIKKGLQEGKQIVLRAVRKGECNVFIGSL